MQIPIAAIIVGSGRRKTNKAAIKALADSIATIGLRIPITVMPKDANGKHKLIAGHHRLEACRLLGWADIAVEVMTNKLDAELWEIAENLHRSELTAMQRNIYIGNWVKLTERKQRQVLGQVGPKRGRPEGGLRAATRELGVKRTTARRAVHIATHLTQKAQKEAERLGLDTNQRALERAAGVPGADEQIRSLHRTVKAKEERAATKAQIQANLRGTQSPQTAKEAFEHWYWSLDAEMQTKVRLWLFELDPATFTRELERLHDDKRTSVMTLH
jgi:ParB-like chromosome segregation protein Spo0J